MKTDPHAQSADRPASELNAEIEHTGEGLVIRPTCPAQTSGNHWFACTAALDATEHPIVVRIAWPPVTGGMDGEYAGNHPFADVLDRVIFIDQGDGYWRRVQSTERTDDGVRLTLAKGASGRRLAVGMPVGPGDLDTMVTNAKSDANAQVESIGTSPRGNPVHGITIGNPDTCEGAFAITAYQHYSEWAGVRVAGSMAEYLLSDDASELRQRWCWLIYPCLNIDALLHGWEADRFQTEGVNMNRDWSAFSMAETRAVRDHLGAIAGSGVTVRHGLDLHMGWHSRDTCGAGLTVFNDEATPSSLVRRQQQFAERLMANADYTDFIWHAGGIERPNFAGWFTRTYGVPGQTLEISRHRWRQRKDGQWVAPSIEREQALGVAIAGALDVFNSR